MSKLFFVLALVWIMCCQPACTPSKNDQTPKQQDPTVDPESYVLARIGAFDYPAKVGGFPRSLEPDGHIRKVPSKDWTSGFYPGVLWYAYQLGNDAEVKERAAAWTWLVEPEKSNDRTHDMGFKINCSFGNAYRITGNTAYRQVMIESASTLATRYNATVGAIRSWDFNRETWDFPVIIDNMMNLELLFLATSFTGDSSYHQMAYQHAVTTLQNHFREDNSSYHVVDYNPNTGEARMKVTHQGIADESAWARGQAWGLYGFTMAYRFTKDERFLAQASKIYAYIFEHPMLPDDLIPYWDYDAPEDNRPRDVSAATVTASALYELAGFTGNEEMRTRADQILANLMEHYTVAKDAQHPFLLAHSTGNMPKADEVDVPIAYADYYFIEALLRQKDQDK